jgi:hypothetical protein
MQLTVDSGQLPVGWEVQKLAEVCQIEKSQGIYTNLPYIGMENNELKQSILQKAFTGELTADTANQTTKAANEGIAA